MQTNQKHLTTLQKAELAVADLVASGGYLQPEQTKEFFEIAINESRLMTMASVKTSLSHSVHYSKIKFGGRILRRGASGQALPEAKRSKPTPSKTEIATHLMKAQVDLQDEVLEDNVEGQNFKNRVLKLIAEKASADMEEIGLISDTASADDDLSMFDGFFKQATSHPVAGGGAKLTKTLLEPLLRALPKEFKKDKKKLRFLTSVNAEQDYRNSLAERATVVGDKFLESDAPAMYSGIPVEAIPLFPENLGTAPNDNRTKCLLVDPTNFIWAFWRQVKVETQRDAAAGLLQVVVSLRMGAKFMHEDAVAVLNDVLAA